MLVSRSDRLNPRLRQVLGLALALATSMFAAVASADDVVASPDVQSQVVVRDRPMGAPAKRVGVVRKGERVTLLESVPYYYRVRLANGTEGYVAKRWADVASVTPAALSGGDLVLHFIDVGQGDATLVECPNGSTILIDSGSTSGQDPDEVQAYVNGVLEKHGGDLDHLIVSHPDADHYNLLEDVLRDVRVRRSWYVGTRADYSDKQTFDWLKGVAEQPVVLGPDNYDPQETANSALSCGAAKVWILAAGVEASKSYKNAMSIVVMIRHGDFEAIVTGDATLDTEAVVLSRFSPAWLDVDLLRVGHHGSYATSTSRRWADTLSPRIAVFSAGYENSYGHPRGEVVDRLLPHVESHAVHGFRSATPNPRDEGPKYVFKNAQEGRGVYATAMSGTVIVSSYGSGYSLKAERN
ncbi:MBL fold metallo-hydrolase [Caulobacter vibrioides]|nr:SH3 domain-containing protein [Caulobacter vibrioides]